MNAVERLNDLHYIGIGSIYLTNYTGVELRLPLCIKTRSDCKGKISGFYKKYEMQYAQAIAMTGLQTFGYEHQLQDKGFRLFCRKSLFF